MIRSRLRAWCRAWLGIADIKSEAESKKPLALNMQTGVSTVFRGRPQVTPQQIFAPYKPPPGVGPSGGMAMDELPGVPFAGWAGNNLGPMYAGTGNLAFFGYPFLAELTQRAEYYVICETIAKDMTRKWGEVKAGKKPPKTKKDKPDAKMATDFSGADPFEQLVNDPDDEGESDDPKKDKIDAIEAELKRLEVRHYFYEAALKDGMFGRYQIVPIFGDDYLTDNNRPELATDLGDGKGKIEQGSLTRLAGVEPLWTYPYNYAADDPLSEWWYRPKHWYVMGRQVHTSRILTFIGRPVPDLLKPAYSFGGLSLVQLAKPYIDKWIATAGSIADLVNSCVVGIFYTQMQDMLNGKANGTNLWERLALFSATKNNQSVMAVDKDTEDYKSVVASLAGLEGLQAQALEHISTVSQIPSVKWTGNEPAGLNASSEGTIRVYNDVIHARQESFFGPHIEVMLRWVQYNLFGEVDPEITFDWFPLEEESEKDRAELQDKQADTDQKYVDMGVLAPEDVRNRLSADSNSPYEGIDPDDLPDLLVEEEAGLEPAEGRPTGEAGKGGQDPGGAANVHPSRDPFEQLTK